MVVFELLEQVQKHFSHDTEWYKRTCERRSEAQLDNYTDSESQAYENCKTQRWPQGVICKAMGLFRRN